MFQPSVLIPAAGALACFVGMVLALKTGRVPNVVVHGGRFIVRREHEPLQFWLSFTALTVTSPVLAVMAVMGKGF